MFSSHKKFILSLILMGAVFGVVFGSAGVGLTLAAPGDGNGGLGAGMYSGSGAAAGTWSGNPTPNIQNPSATNEQLNPNGTTNAEKATTFAVEASFFKWILQIILGVVASFVQWAMDLSQNLDKITAIQDAWRVFLNLADLGFIVALIVIAFATIIHYENYAMKNTLWKLIVAALLVNFSFTIGMSFIQLSNAVSGFLISNITKDKGGLANSLGTMMSVNRLSENAISKDPGIIASIWNAGKMIADVLTNPHRVLLNAIFMIIFVILMLLTFFTLFVMLLVRFVHLAILLIWSPIAWFCWIFPYTDSHWKKWWRDMLKWNIFLPAVLLWIYVAQLVANNVNDLSISKSGFGSSQADTMASVATEAVLGADFFSYAAKIVLICGFIVMGMIAAYETGIAGGKIAYNRAEAMKNWSVNKSKGKAKEWGWRAGRGAVGGEWVKKKAGELSQAEGRGIKKPWAFVQKQLAKGLNRMGAATEAGVKKATDDKEYRKYVSSLDKTRQQIELQSMSGRKLAIAVEELSKSGKLDYDGKFTVKLREDPELLKRMEGDFNRFKLDDKMLLQAAGFRNSSLMELEQDPEYQRARNYRAAQQLEQEAVEAESRGDLGEARAKTAKRNMIMDELDMTKFDTTKVDQIIEEHDNKLSDIQKKFSNADISKNKAVQDLFKEKPAVGAVLGTDVIIGMRQAFVDALSQADKIDVLNSMPSNMNSHQVRQLNVAMENTIKNLEALAEQAKKAKDVRKEEEYRERIKRMQKARDRSLGRALLGAAETKKKKGGGEDEDEDDEKEEKGKKEEKK